MPPPGQSLSREPARDIYQREALRREEAEVGYAEPAPARRPRGFARQAADEEPASRGFSRQSLREAVPSLTPVPDEEPEPMPAAAGAEEAPKPWYLQGRENEERRGLRVRPLRVANGR